MELRKGYKRTECGVIPINWDSQMINKVTNEIFLGLTSKVDYVYIDGFPLIRATDIANGKLNFDNVKYISEQQHKMLTKFRRAKRGDILVSKSGSLGVCVIVDTDKEFSIYESIIVIQSKPILLNDFLLWLIRDERTQERMLGEKVGSSVPHLNLEMFRKLFIQIPPIKEQTAIANALADADAIISTLEKLIEKKRNIKQGSMQQLLKPKKGWEVKRIADVIINFQNGCGFSAIGYIEDGTPIVTMAQIGLDGTFNFNESKVNKWVTSDFDVLKNYHLKDGDLIIAMTDVTPEKNLIGRMAIVKTNQTLLLNQRVGLLRLDPNKVNAYFLKTLSNMRSWRSYCIGSASLGVQANIGTKDIMNGEISLPKIDEQNEIATILADMDKGIELLQTKLSKAKMLKQGMMQELLTGKIRLV